MKNNFVPCSAKHKSCSPAHAALVWGYRDERRRQEMQYELELGYAGERQLMRENGVKFVNFKEWLIANKKSPLQQEQEEKWQLEQVRSPVLRVSSNTTLPELSGSHHMAKILAIHPRTPQPTQCLPSKQKPKHRQSG